MITKKEIDKEVATYLDIPNKKVKEVTGAFLDTVIKHLENKENVQLFPFGNFKVVSKLRKFYNFGTKQKEQREVTSVRFHSQHFKRFFKAPFKKENVEKKEAPKKEAPKKEAPKKQ